LLTDRYLKGIPTDSRAAKPDTALDREDIREDKISKVLQLNEIAKKRGQTMAQMALAWVLRQPAVTSALVGASRVAQIEDSVASLDRLEFSPEELSEIEMILAG
jgi:L-glyceraldehyde 3-phosphate reductase